MYSHSDIYVVYHGRTERLRFIVLACWSKAMLLAWQKICYPDLVVPASKKKAPRIISCVRFEREVPHYLVNQKCLQVLYLRRDYKSCGICIPFPLWSPSLRVKSNDDIQDKTMNFRSFPGLSHLTQVIE